jgi:hypothetical protein
MLRIVTAASFRNMENKCAFVEDDGNLPGYLRAILTNGSASNPQCVAVSDALQSLCSGDDDESALSDNDDEYERFSTYVHPLQHLLVAYLGLICELPLHAQRYFLDMDLHDR